MRSPLTLGLALVLVAGALSGCGTKDQLTNPTAGGTGGSATDQAQVSAVLASDPSLIEDAVYEDPMQATVDGGTAGSAALIHPLRFWRTILDVDRRFTTVFSDPDTAGRPTTALVTVDKFLAGRFNVLALTGSDVVAPPDSDSVAVVHKPLADHWVRHLLLKRIAVGDSGETEWRIAATSGVKVTSFDPQSPKSAPLYGPTHLVSLRIQSGALDTTITDPSALFRLRRVLRFDAGSQVTLTATTGANDDAVLLMLAGFRLRLHPNGDGTYSGTWNVPPVRAIGHFGVNALSHGTLFDDTAPYQSQAWLLPFVITGGELAEYAP